MSLNLGFSQEVLEDNEVKCPHITSYQGYQHDSSMIILILIITGSVWKVSPLESYIYVLLFVVQSLEASYKVCPAFKG